MVKITYQIHSLDDAKRYNFPPPWGSWDFVSANECNSGLWRFEDEVAVEFIGDDRGEPEDASLYRDWAWVARALQDAYQLGLEGSGQ